MPSIEITVPESQKSSFAQAIQCDIKANSLAPDKAALSKFDYALLLRNTRGREVLHSEKWSNIEFSGEYKGDLQKGKLVGEVCFKGRTYPIGFVTTLTAQSGGFQVSAFWQGTLKDLGLKPFKALMGAIRLQDYLRIELDGSFKISGQ